MMGLMMEINLYMDIWPGIEQGYLSATNQPGTKPENVTRYKLTFDIPDPQDPDVEVEVADHNVEKVDA